MHYNVYFSPSIGRRVSRENVFLYKRMTLSNAVNQKTEAIKAEGKCRTLLSGTEVLSRSCLSRLSSLHSGVQASNVMWCGESVALTWSKITCFVQTCRAIQISSKSFSGMGFSTNLASTSQSDARRFEDAG